MRGKLAAAVVCALLPLSTPQYEGIDCTPSDTYVSRVGRCEHTTFNHDITSSKAIDPNCFAGS
eukprot:COSAG05_NODE_190_length_14625_cov_2729.566020_7_plen_63_part_00